MDYEEEKEISDDVLEEDDSSEDDGEEVDPLADLMSEESEDGDDSDEEDEFDDAKLFGGIDDEDEGYNPFDEIDDDEWS